MSKKRSSGSSLRPEQTHEVHHALINLLLEGGGLCEVAHELAAYTGSPVLITNVAGVSLAGQLSAAAQTQFAKFMREVIRSDHRRGKSLQRYAQQFQLCLVPLVVQNEVEGLLIAEISELGDLDRQVLEQGATIATLALIKHQAVHEAEQRLHRDLLEDLLTSETWSNGHLAEQARSLGWQFEAKPVVILLNFGQRYSLTEHGLDQTQLRWVHKQFLKIIRQILAERYPLTIMTERSHGFIILPHLPGTLQQASEQARDLVEAIVRQVETEGVKVSYTIAGGGFHLGIEGLRRSFREAQQALDIGTRLMMRRPVWFDEVHLYLLLTYSNRSEDVQDWLRRTLGTLVEYDRRNKTQLVQTLEIYFDTNQRLQEAARALYIHPNTLKYRLGRIEQILGQDPFDGENQLRFHLATKMTRLLP